MFHSVGLEDSSWSKSHLSEPLSIFSEKLRMLKKRNTVFLHWGDLYEYMSNKHTSYQPSVLLTFDDGYRDNWVYAFPILKKLGIKATIFVSPEFIDPSEVPSAAGFLNVAEMRKMEETGLVDIQSHALTHTCYYCGPDVVDFYHPGDDYPWLAWNDFPRQKYLYMQEDQRKLVPYGHPVFEFGESLIVKRYFPDEELVQRIIDFATAQGNHFWQEPDWRSRLFEKTMAYQQAHTWNDSWETEEAYRKRVLHELEASKSFLERELNKKVDFICWPGGAYNATVLALAKEAGYKAWTLSSRDQVDFRNRPNSEPIHIKRINSFPRYRTSNGKEYGYAGPYYFICGIERHKGSLFYKWLGRILLMFAIVKSILAKRKWSR
jgi:peptidoglycan/xylan/chitin deacetylase (PgdA/CDA1 family)